MLKFEFTYIDGFGDTKTREVSAASRKDACLSFLGSVSSIRRVLSVKPVLALAK